MKLAYMSKDNITAIKGIALIMMFIHHFFTCSGFYVESVSYPFLESIAIFAVQPFRMCVPVFAFLTGYFYYFSVHKNLGYSIRKITNIYLNYWIVFIPFFVFALATGCFQFVVTDVIMEFFALRRAVMVFCWYVIFYALTMLMLPILTRIGKSPIGEVIFLFLVPTVVCSAFLSVFENRRISEIIENVMIWFPCVASGYLCSKYTLFSKLDSITQEFNNRFAGIAFCVVLIIGSFIGRFFGATVTIGNFHMFGCDAVFTYSLDIVYAPLFVYGWAKLLNRCQKTRFIKILMAIGKKSLLMWFLHGIFFNCCKEITQPFLFLPKDPLLVLIFGLALCYVVAIPLDWMLGYVQKWLYRTKTSPSTAEIG